ncbi:WD40-repeat-containing domain protein [Elsinoe ampelina]|uniref:WD40-repeat-containing domain protein n=1 Tax=Elsinoe ampelina TaxID=302913 RepID=A0A6A6GJU1_9PEZI|nr:WD40-repeat-containing domain protein [Elsinoe ampelina]
MEAAIRWAPSPSHDAHRYLIVDVAGNSITLNESRSDSTGELQSERIARYDKVPNFTAFDWSKANNSLLALGLSSGESSLVKIDTEQRSIQPVLTFPRGTQRKCNSISFNPDKLLAVGLDRVRNDHCLNIYDVGGGKEPYSKLCIGEAVSSVRFFPSRPQEIVAAVARQTLRLYDLRDPSFGTGSTGSSVYTRQVNNIAIDPLDDNYFASGGSTGDPTVSIWDRRWLAKSNMAIGDGAGSPSVLDLRPAIDNSQTSTIWSIRFSGLRRGRFAVMGSSGAIRLYDLSTHSMTVRPRVPPSANYYGGNAWNGPQYVSHTHDIQYPFYDKVHGHDESTRFIAFDWITHGPAEGQSLMALRLTREVNTLKAPNPQFVKITARDEMALAQNGLKRTQSWIQGGPPHMISPLLKTHEFPDALALINIHKRRCMEGYRLDCARNRQIVKDDPDLERMWGVINRLESLSAKGGMTSETMDLSFYGVQGVWIGDLGESKNRLLPGKTFSTAAFNAGLEYIGSLHGLTLLDNLDKKTYWKRMLCLELCGWCFSAQAVESKCGTLLEQRSFYRAVALAVYQGHPDLALNMLRNLTRRNLISDTGVGALLAAKELNDQQREMCSWMEEDATDPYLKSILRYIGSNDWKSVTEMSTLILSDRVSVALRYLDNESLSEFISSTSQTCINQGLLPGVLLTGLTETAIPLFQAYLARSSDIQTCVLATAFTNPLYVSDIRWSLWKETYFDLLQSWRLFIERTKFSVEHARLAVKKDGTKLIPAQPRQISLRCVHCNGSLARSTTTDSHPKAKMSFDSPVSGIKSNTGVTAQKVANASGTTCPRCGRHLPRCAVCMQWLGTPEMTSARGQKGRGGSLRSDSLSDSKEGKKGEGKNMDAALGRFVTFCASCNHGLHANHAKQWFAKHGMCPVPDCGCLCGVRR